MDLEAGPAEFESLGLAAVPGVLVYGAVPGTGAATAGLEAGPLLIVGADGQAVDNFLGYCKVLADTRHGETVVLTLVGADASAPQDVEVAFE